MWLVDNTASRRNRRSAVEADDPLAGRARSRQCRRPARAAVSSRLLRMRSQCIPRTQDCGCIGRKAGAEAVHQAEFGIRYLPFAAFAPQLGNHLVKMKQRSRDARM